MKILVAGAGGYLGQTLVRILHAKGHQIIGLGRRQSTMDPVKDCLADVVEADITNRRSLNGKLDGADVVLSTVGLEFPKKDLDYWNVDYEGNLNLLRETERAGISKFIFVSVIRPRQEKINSCLPPMVAAKREFEQALMTSELQWVIFRPTGYFKDIVNVILKAAQKGKVMLVGNGATRSNPLHPEDFAQFIAENLSLVNQIRDVGGPEVYSYKELGDIAFSAVGKPPRFTFVNPLVFRGIMEVVKRLRPLKYPLFQFTLWVMVNDMEAHKFGKHSIKEALMAN